MKVGTEQRTGGVDSREGVMVVTCEGSGTGRVGGSEGEWLKYTARRVG